MKLYLDEDVAQKLFVKLLRKDGHDVLVQSDIKMNGEKDARQMAKAIFFGRVFLTRNLVAANYPLADYYSL